MTKARIAAETPLELVVHALQDLGHIHRSQEAGTLTEAHYLHLMNDTRERLQLLRSILSGEGEEVVELTDAGAAVLTALKVGQNPDVQALIRRAPGLMTAQMLADHPGVKTARRYGDFAAIDGDRA